MKILEFLKKETIKIEYYGARKPKYHKEEQNYIFENDSLVALSTFDHFESLKNFYSIVKDRLIENFDDTQIKDYSNEDNFSGFVYLDQETNLDYLESLNEQVCSISLIEKESLSFSYIILKVTNSDDEEMLVWIKLKSPLKVENNVFYYNPEKYEVKITKEGLKVDNYPTFHIDVSLTSFIMFNNDFYIFDKELYQKYFNLESYYYKQAAQVVYHNNNIISDGELLTKSNARLVYDYFDNIDRMIQQIEDDTITDENIQQTITILNLSLEFSDKKFILKKPQDLVDLLLLSSGCLGVNSLNNEPIKVKKPNYLVDSTS